MNHYVSEQFGDISLQLTEAAYSGCCQYSLFDSFGNLKNIEGVISYPDYGEAYKIAQDKGWRVKSVTFDIAKCWGLNHAKRAIFDKIMTKRVYL